MPTYQYTCTECGHQLEAVQSFSDDPLTVCPECGGRLRKNFSAVGIVFKGSGFYRTDSRGGPVSGGNGKTESSGGSTKETPAAKSDGGSKESSSTKTTTTAGSTAS